MAIRKRGLSFQGNWLHYDGQLMRASEIDPDQLRSILTLGSTAIVGAAQAIYEKNVAQSPPSARIYHPWMFTIKLADYTAAKKVFKPEALLNTSGENANPNDDYAMSDLLTWVHPYLDAAVDAGFMPRVPGRMSGWDDPHDGVWLQIQHPSHHDKMSKIHVWPGKRWPTRQELGD